ncbi:thioredoxin family protein [Vicingaceae bacterium]|nr:thioredoxin family protein [Vicingaceae bacterium]
MKKIISLIALTILIAASTTVNAQTGYKIGDIATDFNLKGTDGKSHSLAEIKDAKGYIVIFTCNHCPFSKMYEDRIIALQTKYEAKGYPVIAINPNDPKANADDSFDKMIVRAKEKGFNFWYLFDDGQKIFPQYGATKTPHVFLLDNKRVVKYIGAIDDNARDEKSIEVKFLENAIEALDAGKKINPETTKAIGCSIKSL